MCVCECVHVCVCVSLYFWLKCMQDSWHTSIHTQHPASRLLLQACLPSLVLRSDVDIEVGFEAAGDHPHEGGV